MDENRREHIVRFKRRALAMAVVSGLVLVAAGTAAYLFFSARPALAQKTAFDIARLLGKKHILGEKGWPLFFDIFTNNAVSTLVTLVGGLVPFLFLPLINPLLNGGVIGLLAAVSRAAGMPLGRFFLAGIAPHGIFEVTAVVYATGLGLSLTLEISRKVLGASSEASPPVAGLITSALKAWALFVVPLLLVAAAVETFVTPHLLGLG
jgi:stage II sporulation protein M